MALLFFSSFFLFPLKAVSRRGKKGERERHRWGRRESEVGKLHYSLEGETDHNAFPESSTVVCAM